jgi:hypothetical protein
MDGMMGEEVLFLYVVGEGFCYVSFFVLYISSCLRSNYWLEWFDCSLGYKDVLCFDVAFFGYLQRIVLRDTPDFGQSPFLGDYEEIPRKSES